MSSTKHVYMLLWDFHFQMKIIFGDIGQLWVNFISFYFSYSYLSNLVSLYLLPPGMDVAGQKTETPIRQPGLCAKSLSPRERKGFARTDKTSCPKAWGRWLQGIENKIS